MKVGIIGIGKLGSIHLRIYKELKEIEKIYLVDTDIEKTSIYKDLPSFQNYRELADKIDLVSIAAPTPAHFEIAKFFLEKKIPVFVEKPITCRLADANKLLNLSQKKKTLLFVGHVERYNNAYLAVKKLVKNPVFIECHRLNPYPYRSLDTGVVLDLMIHDLDIILDLVKDDVKKIEAKGVKVLSPTEDIANVRITFKKNCIANITASRISAKRERKIRIFMRNCYISLDYAEQTVEIYQKTQKKLIKKTLMINKEEPLKKEIIGFINLAKKNIFNTDYCLGAKNALKLALNIQKTINITN